MKFGIKNGKNYLYLVQHTLLWQQQSPVTSLDDSSSTEPKKLLDILNDRAAKVFYNTAANGNFVYSQTRSRVPPHA